MWLEAATPKPILKSMRLLAEQLARFSESIGLLPYQLARYAKSARVLNRRNALRHRPMRHLVRKREPESRRVRMRLATYNVENLYMRARALNLATWAGEGGEVRGQGAMASSFAAKRSASTHFSTNSVESLLHQRRELIATGRRILRGLAPERSGGRPHGERRTGRECAA